EIINNEHITPGNIIVGLSSFGKAIYEDKYNGGMGSNGLTSARHDVFSKLVANLYPESYDTEMPEDLAYSGSYNLTDKIPNTGLTAGELVLSPTRTYAPIITKVLKSCRSGVRGMIHCTGGAQTKILHFAGSFHVVKDNMFSVPPLFEIIQKESGTSWQEMYKVFNMGHRMELYVDGTSVAEEIIAISKEFGVDAQIIGYVESGSEPSLTIKSDKGEFNYKK
ncbi:MAG: AIR synthase-related protein, partial [Rikenellaceae bacterium]